MVGDVNIFFIDDENCHTAEIEIMIAGRCSDCNHKIIIIGHV